MTFKFNLGDEVTLQISGESGTVIGRAEYVNSTPSYYVRYRSADGRAIEAWWTGDALQHADLPEVTA